MADQTHRGLSMDLYEAALETFTNGEEFTADNFEMDAPRQAVSNSLAYLAKQGMIGKGTLRGQYVMLDKAKKRKKANPAQTIYELLDYMAEAEVALRRAAKVLETLDKLGA